MGIIVLSYILSIIKINITKFQSKNLRSVSTKNQRSNSSSYFIWTSFPKQTYRKIHRSSNDYPSDISNEINFQKHFLSSGGWFGLVLLPAGWHLMTTYRKWICSKQRQKQSHGKLTISIILSIFLYSYCTSSSASVLLLSLIVLGWFRFQNINGMVFTVGNKRPFISHISI